MAGTDPEDPATKAADAHKTDYLKGLDANALKGARLGVVRGTSNDNETTAPVFEKALKVLADQGAVLVDVPVTFFEDLFPEQHTLIHWEFREDLEAYLKNTPPQVKVRTLAALVEFNKTDPREKLHAQELLEADLATRGPRRTRIREDARVRPAARRPGGPGRGAHEVQRERIRDDKFRSRAAETRRRAGAGYQQYLFESPAEGQEQALAVRHLGACRVP